MKLPAGVLPEHWKNTGHNMRRIQGPLTAISTLIGFYLYFTKGNRNHLFSSLFLCSANLVTVFWLLPINKQIMDTPKETSEKEVPDLLQKWKVGNWVRTTDCVLGFVIQVFKPF